MQQLKYEFEFLKRFELINCKSTITPVETNYKDADGEDVYVTTFKQLVNSFRYMCNTRASYIYYTVGIMSRFMSKLM